MQTPDILFFNHNQDSAQSTISLLNARRHRNTLIKSTSGDLSASLLYTGQVLFHTWGKKEEEDFVIDESIYVTHLVSTDKFLLLLTVDKEVFFVDKREDTIEQFCLVNCSAIAVTQQNKLLVCGQKKAGDDIGLFEFGISAKLYIKKGRMLAKIQVFSISCGTQHNVLLSVDETEDKKKYLMGFGSNAKGQLGADIIKQAKGPIKLSFTMPVREFTCDGNTTYVLDTYGDLWYTGEPIGLPKNHVFTQILLVKPAIRIFAQRDSVIVCFDDSAAGFGVNDHERLGITNRHDPVDNHYIILNPEKINALDNIHRIHNMVITTVTTLVEIFPDASELMRKQLYSTIRFKVFSDIVLQVQAIESDSDDGDDQSHELDIVLQAQPSESDSDDSDSQSLDSDIIKERERSNKRAAVSSEDEPAEKKQKYDLN
jgi:hypothetical protein